MENALRLILTRIPNIKISKQTFLAISSENMYIFLYIQENSSADGDEIHGGSEAHPNKFPW